MPTLPAREMTRPPVRPADPRRRRGAGWDALVAVALGIGLAVVGWVDYSSYHPESNRPMATFGLITQKGDIRVGEEEFFHTGRMALRLGNVCTVEGDPSMPFRHAEGPTVTLEFWSYESAAQVDFTLVNDYPQQDLTVACNDQTLEQVHLTPCVLSRSYRFAVRPGANRFTITFSCYNGHGIDFDNGDRRPIAGSFQKLDLHF